MGAQRIHLRGLKKQFVGYAKRSVAMWETPLLVILVQVQMCLRMVLLVVLKVTRRRGDELQRVILAYALRG